MTPSQVTYSPKSEALDTLKTARESRLLIHPHYKDFHQETVSLEEDMAPKAAVTLSLLCCSFRDFSLVILYFPLPGGVRGRSRRYGGLSPGHTGMHRGSVSLTQAYLPRSILEPYSLYCSTHAMSGKVYMVFQQGFM